MKNTLIKLAVAVAASAVLLQSVQASPITGNIGFTGSAVLNASDVGSATQVTSWVNPVIVTPGSTSGSFSSVTVGSAVTLFSPWFLNTVAANPGITFWQVGGFTFNLLSSVITTQTSGSTGSLAVALVGTVSGNGYDLTALTGNFSTQNPANHHDDGTVTFTGSFSFNSVPDGGTTMLILGASLSGLALIRRKLVA